MEWTGYIVQRANFKVNILMRLLLFADIKYSLAVSLNMDVWLYLSWMYGCTYHGHMAVPIMDVWVYLSWTYGCTYHGRMGVPIMDVWVYLSWTYGCTYH